MMKFYKYQGAGNDFLIADNRNGLITEKDGVLTALRHDGTQWTGRIADLCDRRYGVGADGLMLLDPGAGSSKSGEGTDFHMTYFNSDGSGGMMCGNGGRCIVAFALDCGVPPRTSGCGTKYVFTAADGLHEAYVLEDTLEGKLIRLRMKDVAGAGRYESLTGVSVRSDGYFLDTGTRHYVRFVEGLDDFEVVAQGRNIRYEAEELKPVGANVNFVEPSGNILKVRTYEKGVEDETFACGTGIVASALAAYIEGISPESSDSDTGRKRYFIRARRDSLVVDFLPASQGLASDVYLTGPARKVCEVTL